MEFSFGVGDFGVGIVIFDELACAFDGDGIDEGLEFFCVDALVFFFFEFLEEGFKGGAGRFVRCERVVVEEVFEECFQVFGRVVDGGCGEQHEVVEVWIIEEFSKRCGACFGIGVSVVVGFVDDDELISLFFVLEVLFCGGFCEFLVAYGCYVGEVAVCFEEVSPCCTHGGGDDEHDFLSSVDAFLHERTCDVGFPQAHGIGDEHSFVGFEDSFGSDDAVSLEVCEILEEGFIFLFLLVLL